MSHCYRLSRFFLLALLMAMPMACSPRLPEKTGKPAEQDKGASTATTAGPAKSAPGGVMGMEGQGVDLRMFDTTPSAGESRKPTFWVHADIFSLAEENVWSFEQAHAVIYGRDANDPVVTMEAGRGRFQEAKTAYLQNGVIVKLGDMKVDLTDIEWVNEERLARTDNPVSIVTSDSQLKASSLRLFPDDKQLVLTNVVGTMTFERTEP